MRISDWSSDVCSSDLIDNLPATDAAGYAGLEDEVDFHSWQMLEGVGLSTLLGVGTELSIGDDESDLVRAIRQSSQQSAAQAGQQIVSKNLNIQPTITVRRSEEHTSELQSLMRISYAVFCLKKKKTTTILTKTTN